MVITVFGMMALFVGCLFMVDGVWKSHVQHVQEQSWPAVEARVVKCSITESPASYTERHTHIRGTSSSIHCRFAYNASGITRESSARIGDSVFTPEKGFLVAPKVTVPKLRAWITHHPSGSLLTIHYDPSNPENISLAGSDNEVKATLPHDELPFGILCTIIGAIMISIVVRSSRTNRERANPDSQLLSYRG